MNHVSIMGNLVRDPELKFLSSGTAVCELSIAMNKKWKDNSGNQKEKAIFVDVTCWAKTAEIAEKYLKKGRKVLIEGEIDQDQWEDKNTGAKRSKLKVVCSRLHLLPNGNRESSQESSQSSSGEENQETHYTPPAGGEPDVPF